MTISKVQGNARNIATTGSTVVVTMGVAPTVGNTLIATIVSISKTVTGITQTNVTWDASPSVSNVASGFCIYVWRGVVGASAGTAVTITLSGAMGDGEGVVANICEYSPTLIIDDSITATGSGSGVTDGNTGTTATCNEDVEVFIGVIGGSSSGNCTQSGPTLGFTLYDGAIFYRQGNSYFMSGSLLGLIVTAKQTGHTHVTFSESTNFKSCIGAFKVYASAPISTTYSIDVLLKKLGLTKTDSIDVLFKKLGITKTYSIDAILSSPPLPYNIDVLLEKFGLTKPFDIDTLLAVMSTAEFSIDMKLSYLTWAAILIDTRLKSLGVTTTISTDVLFKKLGVSKTDSIDVLFKKLDISTITSIDVILQTLTPPTPPVEAPETLMISNPNSINNPLWVRPISWKESQICMPAIRPVPLAESEYLDSDTWVLKPREIECKIRLSDREKDLFESIYGYPSTLSPSATNQYLDFYLIYDNSKYIWHYLVWIREKNYKFAYEYQNNRYVRWWTATLTCDVQSFSGTSSALPTWDDDHQSPTYGYTTYLEDSNWTIYNSPYYDPIARAVKISDEKLDQILSFERDDSHPPMIPNWINQLAEVDSYIWNECVLDTLYTCRMTNAEKYHMDLLLQAHSKIAYEDFIHNLFSKANIAGGEQIINGGFENIMWMTGWTLTADYSVVSTNPHSGTYCVTTDASHLIDIGQTLNPVPFDAIKSFTMWLRTDDANAILGVNFETSDGDDSAFVSIINTSGVWTQYDLKAVMTSLGLTTGDLENVEIVVYSEGDTAIDDVSLNAESRGAWIASVEAQWDPENWIKPWKVTIALKANNSEIESRTANVIVDSTYQQGTMYLDEVEPALHLLYANDEKVGVHKFYFFQPAGSIWDYWLITGDAIKLLSQGDTPNGIGGEHILTVLIYGDCTIQAIFHYPPTLAIVLDSYLNTDPSSSSEGLISIDGTDYSLPHNLFGSVIATPYALEFLLDPCVTTDIFDHWESSVNITITDLYLSSTTFTLDSGIAGTITAVYKGDFLIHVSTNIDNPCFSPHVTIDGVVYDSPFDWAEYYGSYTTFASVNSGDSQHIFDHWETTGGITVVNPTDNPCMVEITDNGTLEAIFADIDVAILSNHPSDPNQGQLCLDGTCIAGGAWQNIPIGPSMWGTGTNYIYWRANGNGGTFSHWATTGGVTVANPLSNNLSNTMTVTGAGTLTVYYNIGPAPDTNTVVLDSDGNNGALPHYGTITVDGTPYTLPYDLLLDVGDYTIEFINPSSAYTSFFSWVVVGSGISVDSPTSISTILHVTTSGTSSLTATYGNPELIINGGFEDDMSWWNSTYSGEITTDNPHSGTHCFHTKAGVYGLAIDVYQSFWTGTLLSALVSGGVWVRCSGSAILTISFTGYQQYTYDVNVSGGWTYIDLAALFITVDRNGHTPPANERIHSIYFWAYTTEDIAIDDCSFLISLP